MLKNIENLIEEKKYAEIKQILNKMNSCVYLFWVN